MACQPLVTAFCGKARQKPQEMLLAVAGQVSRLHGALRSVVLGTRSRQLLGRHLQSQLEPLAGAWQEVGLQEWQERNELRLDEAES